MKEVNRGKQMKSVWEIKPPETWEKRFGKHPTQKPLALLERILLASSNEGDLVLDPLLRQRHYAAGRDAFAPPRVWLRTQRGVFVRFSAPGICSNLVQVALSFSCFDFFT